MDALLTARLIRSIGDRGTSGLVDDQPSRMLGVAPVAVSLTRREHMVVARDDVEVPLAAARDDLELPGDSLSLARAVVGVFEIRMNGGAGLRKQSQHNMW
ncbi:hypothetical protein [Amycolatopsis methanolica]|nr:hypothetical protein [Amycolatopsis methanolica]